MAFDKDFIIFDEAKHTYKDVNGNYYASVSSLLSKASPIFPRDKIAAAISRRDGITVEQVLDGWNQKRDSAISRGNVIHNALEKYDIDKTIVDPLMGNMVVGISNLFKDYKELYSEQVCYSTKYLICGTADKKGFRGGNIFDYSDYKTNEARGIEFFSKYGKFMLDPVSHLEDCNYNKYCLQLGIYAYIDETEHGYKIGQLRIIFIPPSSSDNWHTIAVPYMREEAKAICEWHVENNNIKPIVKQEEIGW